MAKPKRPSTRVKSLAELQSGVPQKLVPRDQLAPYYGGRAGVDFAVREASQLADRVYPNMEAIDPELAAMFPQPEYFEYGQPQALIPTSFDDPLVLSQPEFSPELGSGELGGLPMMESYPGQPIRGIGLERGLDLAEEAAGGARPQDFIASPSQLGIMDRLAVNTSPEAVGMNLAGVDPSGRAAVAAAVERPMTTNLTDPYVAIKEVFGGPSTNSLRGTPLIQREQANDLANSLLADLETGEVDPDALDQLTIDIQTASRPHKIDQSLAAIRRAEMPHGSVDQLNSLFADKQIDAYQALMQQANPQAPVGNTGLTVTDLIAMANVPSNVRRFFGTRSKMVPALLGATTAGAMGASNSQGSGQYSLSQDPNMIGRSTMGRPSF